MSRTVDAGALERAALRLGEAVLDPAVWPQLMDGICAAANTTGAALLQGDTRTPDIPRTASAAEMVERYFRDGWNARDLRANRGVPLLLKGERVLIDRDVTTPEEIRREAYYQECLGKFVCFAGVAIDVGGSLWGALTFQRTVAEGPFDPDDKPILAPLSQRLSEVATLSAAVRRAALSGMVNALGLVRQPALALDRIGRVLAANTGAERLFGDDLRVTEQRLRLRDRAAAAQLDALIARMRAIPDTASLPTRPFPIHRRGGDPLVARALPVDAAARGPFLGARILLTLTDLRPRRANDAGDLAALFKLSPAEARLACVVGSGASPEQAAEELGIARVTARNQLKAVFAKTATHRQSELVALLARLPGS